MIQAVKLSSNHNDESQYIVTTANSISGRLAYILISRVDGSLSARPLVAYRGWMDEVGDVECSCPYITLNQVFASEWSFEGFFTKKPLRFPSFSFSFPFHS